jgi:hypothetical protein
MPELLFLRLLARDFQRFPYLVIHRKDRKIAHHQAGSVPSHFMQRLVQFQQMSARKLE